ncbi:GNAT family N-acetyltransferase [Uliginosibacterium gangwonense]|uniref:GNAT family N-acetyltransferase n=1 Tax=Uliginosibacterium gangwonense TaxID=392736 RepID=UPI00035D88F1|nr:GNAT family N-acetyltransferase [Uliginosibacterium gangwonense]
MFLMPEVCDPWQAFLHTALLPRRLASNLSVDTHLVLAGGQNMPVTLNLDGQAMTSWVASLRNSYGPYARAETDLVGMSPWLKPLYQGASQFAERLLCMGGLKGGLFLNNWLLATNLYSQAFDCASILHACAELEKTYPDVPVVVRSLVAPLHARLMAELAQADFVFLPTRQVWLQHEIQTGGWRHHSDVKKDLALEHRKAATTEWVPGAQFCDADFSRACSLYNALYRGRYPVHNPDYQDAFFRLGVQSGWLRLYGLREPGKPLCGVVGVIEREGVYATPVLGYDLTASTAEGLYRRLMLKAFLEVEEGRGILHCSGGAGHFKRQRGACSAVEFAAIHVARLSRPQRAALRSLAGLLHKLAVPYLQEKVL